MKFNETSKPIGGFQISYTKAEHVVFGAPYDETASFRKGCKDGPASIREFAANLETVNPFTKKDISDFYIHDAGDLDSEVLANTSIMAKKVHDAGKKLLVLGGEHTILPAIASAYTDHLFIIFDAHADMRDSYDGMKNSHACAVRRLLDIVKPEQIILIGIRAVSQEERKALTDLNIQVYWGFSWGDQVAMQAIQYIKEKKKEFAGLYLSVDMDGFDPAFVPGVGNPEPLGLTSREFFSFLSQLPEISAADINELNPSFDSSGASSAVAARLALSILTH